MGDAATAAASPALCCSCGWLFHGSIGDRLCDGGRPAIAGGRARASVEILTVVCAVNDMHRSHLIEVTPGTRAPAMCTRSPLSSEERGQLRVRFVTTNVHLL